ncbi:MAG TPA: uracil-DNA glycosylase family protein [Armatimonadota bacterium]|jgi:uracil-DNA glycosylase
MASLTSILAKIEAEAKREPFDLDIAAYKRAGRPAASPILLAGNVEAPLCLFARDLGQEEVLRGQPLIGSAGRRVRKAIWDRVMPGRTPDSPYYSAVLDHVMLTNTVPYKPNGNVEYDRATKSRFRPFIEDLLVNVWTGSNLIPMGEGAFKWFAQYADKGVVLAFWDDRDARFSGTLDITVTCESGGDHSEKLITLAPIPHPSPRSPFMAQFPSLLEKRLDQFLGR